MRTDYALTPRLFQIEETKWLVSINEGTASNLEIFNLETEKFSMWILSSIQGWDRVRNAKFAKGFSNELLQNVTNG